MTMDSIPDNLLLSTDRRNREGILSWTRYHSVIYPSFKVKVPETNIELWLEEKSGFLGIGKRYRLSLYAGMERIAEREANQRFLRALWEFIMANEGDMADRRNRNVYALLRDAYKFMEESRR